MQTQNPLLDDLAKLMAGAASAAQGASQEARAMFRSQAQRFIQDMDLVGRSDFDAVKALAESARNEADALKERVAALETELAAIRQAVQTGSPNG
ncbi:MAG: accessory factor UbiK family protein [Caulobacterales bacterium]